MGDWRERMLRAGGEGLDGIRECGLQGSCWPGGGEIGLAEGRWLAGWQMHIALKVEV